MAHLRPDSIPTGRDHLDPADHDRLSRFDRLLSRGDLRAARDIIEELWGEAIDAHRGLYQGVANALAAVIAHDAGQHRGAVEIAARTRELLEPYPPAALGLDLEALLSTLDDLR